jgi:uncharacterized tellurite resistance protein B-like protein
MMMRSDVLVLMKVLIAAAWADNRLSQSEINYLKALAKRFRLSDSDWLELEPHLDDPPSQEETDVLFKNLLTRIGTPSGRNEAIRHIQEILQADENVSAEEHDFLEQYTLVLKEASTVELLVRRVRGLFQKRSAPAMLDLDEFVRNKIFFKLRRRLGTEEITPEMYRLCLLGGLMGVVARADGDIDLREMEEIRRHIQHQGTFESEALDTLVAIIEEESVRGLDRARLVAEYTRNLGFDERVHLLDLLFGIAAADGGLTHAELEELRGLSSAMNLSHRQYIDAKLRTRR